MPAEFFQREIRAFCQFKADKNDERENRERHQQREPFEGAISPAALAHVQSRVHQFAFSCRCSGHFHLWFIEQKDEEREELRSSSCTGPKLSGAPAKSVLNCFDPFEHSLLNVLRQRRVVQCRSHSFTLRNRPVQEFHELLSFARVFLLFVNQQPRAA